MPPDPCGGRPGRSRGGADGLGPGAGQARGRARRLRRASHEASRSDRAGSAARRAAGSGLAGGLHPNRLGTGLALSYATMGRVGALLLTVVVLAAAACGTPQAGPASSTATQTIAVAVTSAAATAGRPPSVEPGNDWIRPAGDYSSTRFSPLGEITVDRVRDLAVKASFATGNARGHEAAPLVVGGTMYVVTPYPNDLF